MKTFFTVQIFLDPTVFLGAFLVNTPAVMLFSRCHVIGCSALCNTKQTTVWLFKSGWYRRTQKAMDSLLVIWPMAFRDSCRDQEEWLGVLLGDKSRALIQGAHWKGRYAITLCKGLLGLTRITTAPVGCWQVWFDSVLRRILRQTVDANFEQCKPWIETRASSDLVRLIEF